MIWPCKLAFSSRWWIVLRICGRVKGKYGVVLVIWIVTEWCRLFITRLIMDRVRRQGVCWVKNQIHPILLPAKLSTRTYSSSSQSPNSLSLSCDERLEELRAKMSFMRYSLYLILMLILISCQKSQKKPKLNREIDQRLHFSSSTLEHYP